MHSSDIATMTFATTRLHEGYAIAEVDAFVEKIRLAIRNWESGFAVSLAAEDVRHAKFTPIKFFKGYNELEVDDFLDDAAMTLDDYEAGRTPAG